MLTTRRVVCGLRACVHVQRKQAAMATREAQDHAERKQQEQEDKLQCPICCTRTVNTVMVPCGHTLCNLCANMRTDKCHLCRAPITGVNKFFFPG